MTCKEKPIRDTRRFKRDSILGLMRAKDWIEGMESFPELNWVIEYADDLWLQGLCADIETLEDYVYLIDRLFVEFYCETIRDWKEEREDEDD